MPRRVRSRRALVSALVVVVVGAAIAVALLATRSSPTTTHAAATSSTTTTTTAPPTTTTSAPPTTTTSAPPTTTTTDLGTLPQTMQLPASSDPQFAAEMQALWQGVVQGSVTPAIPAFFPKTAYVQLKTGIADPAGDWQNRLVADYGLDIEAAHALLGPDPAQATFVSVSVPEQYAHWIPAGVCANGIGYYEVANSRVVYQLGGVTKSFGIASLISWRGEWYVVHFGAILRSGGGGEVDDPETGTGYSAASSTC